jgi:hypothetical protein
MRARSGTELREALTSAGIFYIEPSDLGPNSLLSQAIRSVKAQYGYANSYDKYLLESGKLTTEGIRYLVSVSTDYNSIFTTFTGLDELIDFYDKYEFLEAYKQAFTPIYDAFYAQLATGNYEQTEVEKAKAILARIPIYLGENSAAKNHELIDTINNELFNAGHLALAALAKYNPVELSDFTSLNKSISIAKRAMNLLSRYLCCATIQVSQVKFDIVAVIAAERELQLLMQPPLARSSLLGNTVDINP